MVTLENYEEYIIRYIDEELNAAELQELQAFMNLHPELRSEMVAYENTRLLPDTTQIFEGKEQLLKKPNTFILSPGQWRSYGAAAGIIALLGTAILFWQHRGNNVTTVVNVTVNRNIDIQPLNNPVTTVKPIKKDIPVQQTVAAVVKQENKLHNHLTVMVVNTSTIHNKHAAQPQQEAVLPISPVAITKAKPLSQPNVVTNSKISPVMIEQTATVENVTTDDEPKDLITWLPIDDIKKQGLKDLKNTVNEKVKEVRNITNNLKETALVFKFGKKEITLNF
jgi:hypothetical protein